MLESVNIEVYYNNYISGFPAKFRLQIPGFSRIYPIKDSQNFYLNADTSQIWKFVNWSARKQMTFG